MPRGESILTDNEKNNIIRSINSLQTPIQDAKKNELIEQVTEMYLKARKDMVNWKAKQCAKQFINNLLKKKTKYGTISEIIIITKKDFEALSSSTKSFRSVAATKNCEHSTLFKKFTRLKKKEQNDADTNCDTTTKRTTNKRLLTIINQDKTEEKQQPPTKKRRIDRNAKTQTVKCNETQLTHGTSNESQVPVLDRMIMIISCGYCKASLKISDCFYRCGKCKMEFYCTVQCQTKHWNIHKNKCYTNTNTNKQIFSIITGNDNNIQMTDETMRKEEIQLEAKHNRKNVSILGKNINDREIIEDITVVSVKESTNNTSNVIDLVAADTIGAFVKFCPKCKQQVNRSQKDIDSTCSIMTCRNCTEWTYWCWDCSAIVDMARKDMRCLNCRKVSRKWRNCSLQE